MLDATNPNPDLPHDLIIGRQPLDHSESGAEGSPKFITLHEFNRRR